MFERTTHESEPLAQEAITSDSAERAVAALDTYIRENPWTSVAIGASLGLILGAFIVSFTSGSSDD